MTCLLLSSNQKVLRTRLCGVVVSILGSESRDGSSNPTRGIAFLELNFHSSVGLGTSRRLTWTPYGNVHVLRRGGQSPHVINYRSAQTSSLDMPNSTPLLTLWFSTFVMKIWLYKIFCKWNNGSRANEKLTIFGNTISDICVIDLSDRGSRFVCEQKIDSICARNQWAVVVDPEFSW